MDWTANQPAPRAVAVAAHVIAGKFHLRLVANEGQLHRPLAAVACTGQNTAYFLPDQCKVHLNRLILIKTIMTEPNHFTLTADIESFLRPIYPHTLQARLAA